MRQRAREHIGLAAGLEHPRTEDRLGQLLDVERHAVGLGDDMIDHLAGQRPAAGQMTDHRLHLRPLQAVERDRRHVRALRPGRRQFRPIGRDDQHRRGRRLLDQHAQCFQRRRIGPVQILPRHQHRGALGRFDQPCNDRIEGRIALLLRRHRKARIAVLGRWHGHQIGEQPDALGAGQSLEAGEPGLELRQVLVLRVLGLPAEQALQVFDDRMKGARGVKRRTAERHPDVVLAGRFPQSFHQAGLADPGLPLLTNASIQAVLAARQKARS